MQPRDQREGLSLLLKLSKSSLTALDLIARENNIAFKQAHETYSQYISRIWQALTGRSDFTTAYSMMAFLNTAKGEPTTPGAVMKRRLEVHTKAALDEVKAEENRTDREFLKLLKDV